MLKWTARSSSGRSVRAYWTARAAAMSSCPMSTRTTWRCSTGASAAAARTGLELLLLRHVLPVQAEQSEVHRRSDDGDDPGALGELGHQQDADHRERQRSRERVDHHAELPSSFANAQVVLDHAESGKGESGEDADRVQTDQRVQLRLERDDQAESPPPQGRRSRWRRRAGGRAWSAAGAETSRRRRSSPGTGSR